MVIIIRSSTPGMTKTAGAAQGVIKVFDRLQNHPADRGQDKLRYSISTMDHIAFPAMIDQAHFHFPAIISIYGAGRIDNGNSMFNRQTGTRTDLQLKPLGQGHAKAGRNQNDSAGWYCHRLFNRRPDIHSGRKRCFIFRKIEVPALFGIQPAKGNDFALSLIAHG